MKLLAVDTSSVACSVALQVGHAVTEGHEEQAREHTRLLMPMIRELLDEAGTSVGDLDAIVLGNGPGSFIGMRIAAAVAQGLAYGGGIGIVPVSSLAAVAAQVFAETDAAGVAVTQDAHMQEVYLGLFARGERDSPVAVTAERLQGQTAIDELEGRHTTGWIAAGYGWTRYPALLAANEALLQGVSPVLYPRARYLLGLARPDLDRGTILDPRDIDPAYLRQKVAEKPRKQQP